MPDDVPDLRPLLFAGAPWYAALAAPSDDAPSAWYAAKGPADHWPAQALTAAAAFARDHGLLDHYRRLFAGVRAAALLPARAAAEGRHTSFPVWEIAHELFVARYLERVLGWRLDVHEPPGAGARRGDWQFTTPSGRSVFVEVKSVAEREVYGNTGVYSRPDYRPRLRDVVRGAYKQLPDDGRATLVVLVGHETLSIPFGILHGDLCAALFGQFQVRLQLAADGVDAQVVGAGPSFRDTLVHGTKHRRLGCVAGLVMRGMGEPEPHFYSIDNPYAVSALRLPESDVATARRIVVDGHGAGHERLGLPPAEVWARMRVSTDPQHPAHSL